MISLPSASRSYGDRRHVGLRIAVDEDSLPDGESVDVVIGVLRREQLQVPAVQADAVEVAEVRIAALLLADARGSRACGSSRRRAAAG